MSYTPCVCVYIALQIESIWHLHEEPLIDSVLQNWVVIENLFDFESSCLPQLYLPRKTVVGYPHLM